MHNVLRTDTQQIPLIKGAVDATAELAAPWLRPPVPHRRRVTRRAGLLRHSPFARHLTAAATWTGRAVWALAVVLVIGTAAVSLVVGFPQVIAAALQTIGVLP